MGSLACGVGLWLRVGAPPTLVMKTLDFNLRAWAMIDREIKK